MRRPGGDRLRGRLHIGQHRSDEAFPRLAGLLGGAAELALALERAGERLLGALALMDIDAGAHIADEQAIDGIHRRRPVEYPAVLAVATAQAVFDLEGLARIEGAYAA